MNLRAYSLVLALLGSLFLFPMAMPFSHSVDTAHSSSLKTVLPMHIGAWNGEDVEVDEKTYQILETRNLVARTYRNSGGELIDLLLVGSEKDRRVAHPPEVCYMSSNYSVMDQSEGKVQFDSREIPVKEFLAKNENDDNRAEFVLYLYKIGDKFTTNYYAQQLQFAADRVTRRKSQVLLIRLAGARRESLEPFLKEILPFLSKSDLD